MKQKLKAYKQYFFVFIERSKLLFQTVNEGAVDYTQGPFRDCYFLNISTSWVSHKRIEERYLV